MTTVVVDNDLLIKGAAYELLEQLISVVPSTGEGVGLLGAARYLVPDRLRKMRLNKDSAIAVQHFENLAARAEFLEPSPEESKLAGELEFHAQKSNLSLDPGESQLLAILIIRSLDKLATGDKRAIVAMEQVSGYVTDVEAIRGKILCLEQLFHRLMGNMDTTQVRQCVCEEPNVDKALSICFGCHAVSSASEHWLEGLQSYIADIRRRAEILLCL